MIQSTLFQAYRTAFHVAIVMDGNGRWADQRGLSRCEGHKQGARVVSQIVEAALPLGITTLTLYAFSSDNWKRPNSEVQHLMRLFEEFLYAEQERCRANGVRLNIIGRRDRLSPSLLRAVSAVEQATAAGEALHLRIAIDYSARDAILKAALRIRSVGGITREVFSSLLGEVIHSRDCAPDVDLLIRTGGERRLSDFLLWECAYAELVFWDGMWPDFRSSDLEAAVEDFKGRSRRFGALASAVGV